MIIWLIETGEPLPIKSGIRKFRIALLAEKLVERGHEVFWWASAFDHQKKTFIAARDKNYSISEGYAIRVLRGLNYRKNVSLARYISNQIIALKFRIQSKKYPKPDIIIVTTPDHLMAYEVARYARGNNIPFMVDILDLWPDIFLDRLKNTGLYNLGKMVLAFDFLRLSFLLKNANCLLAVSEGYLRWGLNKVGRLQNRFDKVVYLGYKPLPANPVDSNEKSKISVWLEKRKNQKIILFIGTFGVSYDLELVVDVAAYFEKSGRTDICFVLAGTGEKFDLISRRTAGLNNLVLTGWIDKDEIDILLSKASVGLLTYTKDAPQGLSNKPFEYLSAGLPLVSSLTGEMSEFINQYQFGLNYSPGDLDGLRSCIERLVDEPDLYGNLSRKASDFFKEFGDANNIYHEYARHIEKFFAEQKEEPKKERSEISVKL
ncbi:MAG: glycosyltransferase family 4 protein [Victivallaceae bacterium]|nr:glycosyltransferase family 4 protein [Victivallaceae bacterium]